MRNIFVLAILVALAACKSADGKQLPAESPEPAKATMESVRAEACSCADEACADRVMEAIEAQRVQFEKAYVEATTCAQKFQPDPGEGILKKMGEFKDMVCACKDKACIDGMKRAMAEWAMKNMETLQRFQPSEAQEAQAQTYDAEMDACEAKVSPQTP